MYVKLVHVQPFQDDVADALVLQGIQSQGVRGYTQFVFLEVAVGVVHQPVVLNGLEHVGVALDQHRSSLDEECSQITDLHAGEAQRVNGIGQRDDVAGKSLRAHRSPRP